MRSRPTELLRRVLPGLVLLVAAGSILRLSVFAWRPASATDKSARPSPDAYVPVEARHAGLDTPGGAGIHLLRVAGSNEVEIGAIALRKKKVGFVRIGAFNEIVARDVRIRLDERFLDAPLRFAPERGDGTVSSRRPAAPPAPRSGRKPSRQTSPSGRRTPASSRLVVRTERSAIEEAVEAVWRQLPGQEPRVRTFTILGFSVGVRTNRTAELLLLQCDRVTPEASGQEVELALKGRVRMENGRGERLRCEEATLRLSDGFPVTAINATVEGPTGPRSFPRLLFTLRSLVKAPGFAQNYPAGPADVPDAL